MPLSAEELASIIGQIRGGTETLDLSFREIDSENAAAIAAALRVPDSAVTNLYLGNNNIGDAGAAEIAAALPDSAVTNLDLEYNKIGNAGAKKIADALHDSKVTTLKIWYNNITNEEVHTTIATSLEGNKKSCSDNRSDWAALVVGESLSRSGHRASFAL